MLFFQQCYQCVCLCYIFNFPEKFQSKTSLTEFFVVILNHRLIILNVLILFIVMMNFNKN